MACTSAFAYAAGDLVAQQHGQSGPLAAPQLGSCASSGRAWQPWLAQRSKGRGRLLGAQPPPRVLELAAFSAADFTVLDLSGKGIKIMKVAISRALSASEAASEAAPKG